MKAATSLLLAVALAVLIGGARGVGQSPLLAASPESSQASPKVGLRLITEGEAVDLGKAFALTVIRTWTTDLAAEDWEDAALEPLVVRLLESARRESDGRIEETRRYRAYAFLPDALIVPEVTFAAWPVAGGEACVARAGPLELRVRSALGPASPAAPELPGDLLAAPRRWPLGEIVAALAVLVALLGGLRWWMSRARAAVAESGMAPDAVALRRLRALRERGLRGPEELEVGCVELASLLRDFVVGRCAVKAREMTSEELVASLRVRDLLASADRDRLEDVLTSCDRGKYGRIFPTSVEMEGLLESAECFIEGARRAEAPGAGGGGGVRREDPS